MMEIFYDFNNYNNQVFINNANIKSLENSQYIARLIDFNSINNTGKNAYVPEYLNESEDLLNKIRKELIMVMQNIEKIKLEAEKFEASNDSEKDEARIRIDESITKIYKTFNNDFFYKLKHAYFQEDYWGDSSIFYIQTGLFMDQRERLYLGPNSNINNLSVQGLGLDKLDLNKNGENWSLIIENAIGLIYIELEKIEAYKKRTDYIKYFNTFYDKPYGYIYDYKKNILSESAIELSKNMILRTNDYLDETRLILEELKELTKKTITNINSVDRLCIRIEASQLIDEINRIASHSQFNGMSLLTGRFSKNSEESRYYKHSININLDESMKNSIKINIESFTAYDLGLIDSHNAPIDISDKTKYDDNLNIIESGLTKVREQREVFDKILKKTENLKIYEENPLSKYIDNYDFKNFIEKQNITEDSFDPDDDIYQRNLKTIFLMIKNLNNIEKELLKYRNLAIKLSNSIYNSSEIKDRMLKDARIILKNIDDLIKNGSYNKYVQASNTKCYDCYPHFIELDLGNGMNNKVINLYPITEKSLQLNDNNKYFSLETCDSANSSIGTIDTALNTLYADRIRLNSAYKLIMISQNFNTLNNGFNYVDIMNKKDQNEAIKANAKRILLLLEGILKETEYYKWKLSSGIYVDSDILFTRMLMCELVFSSDDVLKKLIFIIKEYEQNKVLIDNDLSNKILEFQKVFTKTLDIEELHRYFDTIILNDSNPKIFTNENIIEELIIELENLNDSIKAKSFEEIETKYKEKISIIDLDKFEPEENIREYQKLKGINLGLKEIEKSYKIIAGLKNNPTDLNAKKIAERKKYINKIIKLIGFHKAINDKIPINIYDKKIELHSLEYKDNNEKFYERLFYNRKIVTTCFQIYKMLYILQMHKKQKKCCIISLKALIKKNKSNNNSIAKDDHFRMTNCHANNLLNDIYKNINET